MDGSGDFRPPTVHAPLLFDDGLIAKLDAAGWDELDVELELLTALGEDVWPS